MAKRLEITLDRDDQTSHRIEEYLSKYAQKV